MSLIKCPECGHEVSTKAPLCPHCGVSIAGNLKRCPVCDTILLNDVERCPQCDTHFIVENKGGTTTTPPSEAPHEETAPALPIVEKSDEEKPVEGSLEKPVAEVAPPKKKSKSGWMLFIVIAVLAALTGLIIWQIKSSREASAEAAFTLLQDCNDPQNFEDFIMRFPKNRHIAEVEARLEELRQEEIAWKAATLTMNPDIVRDFIDNYPTSAHQAAALHRIDTLDWREADRLKTSVSYTAYITAHAAGDFVTEAYTARDEAIKREEQAYKDSLAAARSDSLVHAIASGIDQLVQ